MHVLFRSRAMTGSGEKGAMSVSRAWGNARKRRRGAKKKADVAERPAAFDHVGLLVNGPPGTAGLPLI